MSLDLGAAARLAEVLTLADELDRLKDGDGDSIAEFGSLTFVVLLFSAVNIVCLIAATTLTLASSAPLIAAAAVSILICICDCNNNDFKCGEIIR